MKATMSMASRSAMVVAAFSLLFVSAFAAPLDSEDEQSDNSLIARPESLSAPWDAIDAAALGKLLIQLNAEDRMVRVNRAWPGSEPRGWGLRMGEGRLARPWRADKRQVRFRQCYFNPISCFRK